MIHNLITSRAVPELVTRLGGTPVRTRVGHSFIKADHGRDRRDLRRRALRALLLPGLLARRLRDARGAARARRPRRDRTGRSPSLLAEYTRYVATGEINSTVADQAAVVAEIEQEYGAREGVTLDHLDGLTVTHPDWWFNVRASNTEPLLRLNAEAGDQETLDRLRDDVLATIRSDS